MRPFTMKLLKGMASAGERISLGMNQTLDLQHLLDIAAAVKALTCSTLIWLELGKLRLPKAQHIGLKVADARHVSDLEVETVRDRRRGVEGALMGRLRSHTDDEEDTAKDATAPSYSAV